MRKINYIFIDSDTQRCDSASEKSSSLGLSRAQAVSNSAQAPDSKSRRPVMSDLRHQLSSLGPYHFIVNSEGCVIPLTDLHRTRELIPGPIYAPDKYNRCSIFIRYCGSLRPESWILEHETGCKTAQHQALLDLLVQLRQCFPTAKILGLSEINGKELHSRNIIASDAMNLLRSELSNLP